ncbi:hypothetical protein MVEN_01573900 [Mycena venus]|uniref:Uncharacterized protein n=1 Tax=Mycena venus TaxID=2733690 RepID=A0A8H7CRH2_9AGAR|nr:hypothetical protein MVEN_01573900 [Mycena venus]
MENSASHMENSFSHKEIWNPVFDATALRNIIPWQRPFIPINKQDSSPISILVQQAKQTILNELPLCAIAEAYAKKAEFLAYQGDPIASVYLEYCKYLILEPHKESEEYLKICRKVQVLEEEIMASFPASDLQDYPLHSPSQGNRTLGVDIQKYLPQWKLFCGLLIGAAGSLLVQRISAT